MARPGACGLGPGLGLKYGNCVAGRAGPGLDILFAGRAGPGPHKDGPGLHNCCGPGPGLGLKSYLRAGPGPKFQARAGPSSVHPAEINF